MPSLRVAHLIPRPRLLFLILSLTDRERHAACGSNRQRDCACGLSPVLACLVGRYLQSEVGHGPQQPTAAVRLSPALVYIFKLSHELCVCVCTRASLFPRLVDDDRAQHASTHCWRKQLLAAADGPRGKPSVTVLSTPELSSVPRKLNGGRVGGKRGKR